MHTRSVLTVAALLVVGASLSARAQPAPLRAHAVVGYASHHLSAPASPEWVLLRPTSAPARFDVVQEYQIHGCTVSGQPRVAVADRRPVRQRVTFVTHEEVIPGVVTERAVIGVNGLWRGGDFVWWEAYAVPDDLRDRLLEYEVIALEGHVAGLSVERAEGPPLRAVGGAFTRGCEGPPPSLARVPGGGGADGRLYCFGRGRAVVESWDPDATPGRDFLEAYRSVFVDGRHAREVHGRFVRLLRRGSARMMVVSDADGGLRVAPVD